MKKPEYLRREGKCLLDDCEGRVFITLVCDDKLFDACESHYKTYWKGSYDVYSKGTSSTWIKCGICKQVVDKCKCPLNLDWIRNL